ncbi:ammonium transporter [Bacteroides reticulotermitis JCM 10512]|uniref:Ammonium transporter n=1 Tax=Bacteroides reticulotermitis JCM 10512 TaxID=1445607 RepID=W4UZR0_9BACE|nr:ammonium transporter [Bacteroides reticulotermitis JCM 10512]
MDKTYKGHSTKTLWIASAILLFTMLGSAKTFAQDSVAAIDTIVASTTVAAVEAAPEAAEVAAPTLDSGNTAWIIVATILVLLMTIPGLALFYGGLVRQKKCIKYHHAVFASGGRNQHPVDRLRI